MEGLSADVRRAAAAEEDDQHWERIEAFVGGYGSVAHLTPEEIALLPLCLRLRRMITFLHRMAQHWDGQASLDDGTLIAFYFLPLWMGALSPFCALVLTLPRPLFLACLPACLPVPMAHCSVWAYAAVSGHGAVDRPPRPPPLPSLRPAPPPAALKNKKNNNVLFIIY